jgi:hypothetical protein
MGKIIFFFLPNRPEKSRYLTKLQRAVALTRAKQGLHPEPPETINKTAVKPAFLDIRIYLYALLYMCILMPNLSLVYFIPGIVKQIGFEDMPGNALMLIPPLASSFIGMIFIAWWSDHLKDRGRWICFLNFMASVGYVLLLTVRLAGMRYFAVFLVVWGSLYNSLLQIIDNSPAIPLTLSWISGNCIQSVLRN